MRIHFYISIEELENLNRMINGKKDDTCRPFLIASSYFEDSIHTDISYDNYVMLNDSNLIYRIISL